MLTIHVIVIVVVIVIIVVVIVIVVIVVVNNIYYLDCNRGKGLDKDKEREDGESLLAT